MKESMHQTIIPAAASALRQGGIIAYPTEGVYGLGCDPFNASAVYKLCALKHRPIDKGLILIAASWSQVQHLTSTVPKDCLKRTLDTWPGPVTWVFPASNEVPFWLKGKHNSIALRVTKHPVARLLCDAFASAIVSTSANHSGEPPARDASIVSAYFGDAVSYVINAPLGSSVGPTPIRDVMTGESLRL